MAASGRRHVSGQQGPMQMNTGGRVPRPATPKPISTPKRLWLRLRGKAL